MSDDLVKRAKYALHDMQGRVDASKLAMFSKCIDRIEELEAKLARANERAFKEGLRYSINVKICDEHDVQTAWDWSKLKQETLTK